MLPPAPSHVALTPARPPAPPPAPETGVNNTGGRGLGCVGSPAEEATPAAPAPEAQVWGRRWRHQREGQWEGEVRELPNPWQRLDPFWTGTGVTGHHRVGWGGGGRPGQAGSDRVRARPWLQPFPALIVLGENRTQSGSHCPAPQLCSPGAREGCWETRESQRLLETEMLRDAETDTKGKGSVKSQH